MHPLRETVGLLFYAGQLQALVHPADGSTGRRPRTFEQRLNSHSHLLLLYE